MIRFLRWLWFWLFRRHEAVALNARVVPLSYVWDGLPRDGHYEALYTIWTSRGKIMAKIGDKFRVFVAPTNAAGAPAPVFGLDFQEAGAQYDFDEADTALSVVFVAAVPGPEAVVTITAKSKSGADLSASVTLPAVDAPPVDEEAVALNAGFAPV